MSDWSWFDFADLAQFGSSRSAGDCGASSPQVFFYNINVKHFFLFKGHHFEQVALALDASSFGASPNDATATHLILVVPKLHISPPTIQSYAILILIVPFT